MRAERCESFDEMIAKILDMCGASYLYNLDALEVSIRFGIIWRWESSITNQRGLFAIPGNRYFIITKRANRVRPVFMAGVEDHGKDDGEYRKKTRTWLYLPAKKAKILVMQKSLESQ